MIKEIELSRREMEVLNTTLSAEIMKMNLHYGNQVKHDDRPERLRILYSLRDKLVDAKELNPVGTTRNTE